jgi:MFS family permease
MRDLKVLCAITLAHFTVMGIYLSALPLFVTDALGGSRAAVGVAVGSFFISALVFRPPVGRALDTWGRRPFLIAAPAVVAVSSFGLLVADSIAGVIALRFFQGIAGATFYIAAVTIATDLAPQERRAEVITIFSLFLYGGIAAGPAVGEYLVRGGNFDRAWIVAGILAIGASLAGLLLPETGDSGEKTARPLRFLHPASVSPGLVLMFAATGYASITSFSPLYARAVGIGSSGTLYLLFAASIVVVRLATRTLADRRGRIAVAFPGTVAAAAGMACLAVAQPVTAYIGVALYASGFALIFPALMALTADRVPDAERGEAMGSFTAFFDVGAGAGSYAVGALAAAFGFSVAFGVPAALCVVGIVILGRSRAQQGRTTSPEPA